MKAILMLLIVLVVMLFTVSITPTPAPDSDDLIWSRMTYIVAITPTTAMATSWYCDGWFTVLSPSLQKYCLTEWMMDQWDPLDWGDGDADDWGNG